MIEHLMSLGLTEIESRCYIALYEKPHQSGYEVAKTIGVSRSNVYASLASLVQKGASVVSEEGKTRYYSAVPIKDLLAKLRMEFKQSSRYLRKELGKTQQAPYEFTNAYGHDNVIQVLRRTLGSAEHEILAEIDPSDEAFFQEVFQDLDVSVEIFPIDYNPSNFMFIIDGERVVTGTLDESLVPSIMTTRHPVLVERFKRAYNQNK